MEADIHVIDSKAFAVRKELDGGLLAEAVAKEGFSFAGGQIRSRSKAGVVAMGVGYEGAFGREDRIDVEIARRTIKASLTNFEHTFIIVGGGIWREIWRRRTGVSRLSSSQRRTDPEKGAEDTFEGSRLARKTVIARARS